MIRKNSITLLVLALFILPSLAQESPTQRFNSFIKVAATAKSLSDIKPYFSARSWKSEFAALDGATEEEKKEFLSGGLDDFKGATVKKEAITDGKATLTVQTKDGNTIEVLMIKENNSWVIDG